MTLMCPHHARADQAGLSFWLPGLYGSLAAVPAQPGWSFAGIGYFSSVSAGGDKTFSRGARVEAGLDARASLGIINATYVFANPVLGAQAAVGMMSIVGRTRSTIDATLSGPNGNAISGSRTDTVSGVGDLYPIATLKWNQGVHNFMAYVTGNIPVGAYETLRAGNIGLGHGAIDGGGGYTYFNPQTGHEFSAVAGLTYNFKNTDIDYRSGVDFHVDWAASQFLSRQLHVGAVGYFYNQLTGDSGSGAILGDFKSRVAGVGPQIGYIFPVGTMQGYLNLKGYWEFAAQNRPEGKNVWLTFAISPAPPMPSNPMVRK
ncbi:MAG: transporter [Xanthobacteraceae bacterium]|nr:transporter [Xanthobacteraceae bacterium]